MMNSAFFCSLERNRLNATDEQSRRDTVSASRGQLIVPDESTLSRYVAARLDLFISQSLLNRNVKLSIIKRCWEDQLRLKRTHQSFYSFIWDNISFVSMIR